MSNGNINYDSLLFIILSCVVNSASTNDGGSSAAEHRRPLPSVAASVPRGRISSTLPAFTIPVADSRMSITLPANNGAGKLSMPGSARRGFRCKDAKRRDRGSCQPGRSKQRHNDRPDELVLRVVPIDISDVDGHSPCQQETLATSDVAVHSTIESGNDDDSDTTPCQFQRTATVRQGKYFKKSGRRSVTGAETDVLHGTKDECPHQVRTLVATADAVFSNNFNYNNTHICTAA